MISNMYSPVKLVKDKRKQYILDIHISPNFLRVHTLTSILHYSESTYILILNLPDKYAKAIAKNGNVVKLPSSLFT